MGKLFGTFGVRGVVGEDLTEDVARRLGLAFGTYLGGDAEVLVGGDTRTSTDTLKDALISGLTAAGCDVVDVGIAPTPAVQYLVDAEGFDAGAVVTASHNPPEFNGIKLLGSDGCGLSREDEQEIERIYFEENPDRASWDRVGNRVSAPDLLLNFEEAVLDYVGDFDGEGLRVVVDAANGAASSVTPRLLSELGVEVISVNAHPDGRFPGREPEPSEENLETTMNMVRAAGADFGLAHDGDADRLILITGDGEFVPGDYSLAIVAAWALDEGKGSQVVTPVSSSMCVQKVVEDRGGEVIWTKVGEPVVVEELKRAEDPALGGEENGGIIYPDFHLSRNGIITALLICKLVAEVGSLDDLLAEVPKYHLHKTGVECPDDLKPKVMERVESLVEEEELEDVLTIDGVKLFYEDGWVLVRPSGTEPLIRVFGEARDRETAIRRVEHWKERVEEIVSELKG
ncbi:phosphoglucosamine mutase [Methanopyrus kandleri]|uniref:Phosphomannomutase n=2 Tax=Methanopyrus kandleri TaxID=2320 RepID=Q8TWW1_METKA|nr:phosphoglucosamine mutase [Methanopyrus kandleri]AAM02133.1 Phosphomannomutase [Methanopyrus kandleri AV19]HII69852.1 phosphoglucosamine mutase [Methanopyrus kandleri]